MDGYLWLIHIMGYHCMFLTSHNLCKLISSLSSQLFQQMYRFSFINSILLIYTLYFLQEYMYIIELVCESHQVWPLGQISWKINLHSIYIYIYTIQKDIVYQVHKTLLLKFWIYTSKIRFVHYIYIWCVWLNISSW